MKKYILVLLILIAVAAPFFIFKDRYCPLSTVLIKDDKPIHAIDLKTNQTNMLKHLKYRKDKLALAEAEEILSQEPSDLCALWAKAEVLRRTYKFKESESLLNRVLTQSPDHAPSLISLSYIRYHNNEFEEGLKLLKRMLSQPDLDKESEALAYMLVGSINAKKVSLGGWFSKIVYGFRIKSYFEKAKALSPDLSEIRLGLGSFYLLAPSIIGGDIDKAVEELQCAVELTPDFATASARLAQAYKKKGNLEKYNFYLKRTEELDPENEILKALK